MHMGLPPSAGGIAAKQGKSLTNVERINTLCNKNYYKDS
jgi:hypothetical protein